MILGPVKALYSIKYYLENAEKPLWKGLLFNLYLFFISAILLAAFTYITGKPVVNNIIDKVAYYMPDITVQQGVVTVNGDEPLLIEPKELNGYNIVFDTGRTEPVYPTEMAQARTLFLVTSDTAYFNFQERFQATEIPEDANMTITPQTVLDNKTPIGNIMLYTVSVIIILAQLVKIPLMLLLGFVVAAVVNAFTRAAYGPLKLFKLSCYMQAPVTALYLLNFISPVKIPLIVFVYLIVFAIYAQLVISKHIRATEEPAAEEVAPEQENAIEEDVNEEPAQEEEPLPADEGEEKEHNDTEDKE